MRMQSGLHFSAIVFPVKTDKERLGSSIVEFIAWLSLASSQVAVLKQCAAATTQRLEHCDHPVSPVSYRRNSPHFVAGADALSLSFDHSRWIKPMPLQ